MSEAMEMVGAAVLMLAVGFIVWSAFRAVERDREHSRHMKGK